MALTDVPDNPSITHRAPLRTQGQIYCGGDLAVAGNAEVDGTLTLNNVALTGTPVLVQRGTMNVSAGGAAGTHTVTFTLPAGSQILDIVVYAVTVWNAGTSATLIVGDGTDDDGFYAAVNLKATDLVADEALRFSAAGGVGGAFLAGTATHWTDTYNATADTVVAKLTLVGTTATTGSTVIDVIYCVPSTDFITAATYAAT